MNTDSGDGQTTLKVREGRITPLICAVVVLLAGGGLAAAGWAVSGAMTLYFGYYVWRLWQWPVRPAHPEPPAVAAEVDVAVPRRGVRQPNPKEPTPRSC